MDTQGFEPWASHMLNGCDATTPCALDVQGQPASISRLMTMLGIRGTTASFFWKEHERIILGLEFEAQRVCGSGRCVWGL